MAQVQQSGIRNRLLAQLTQDDFDLLASRMVKAPLVAGADLYQQGEPVRSIYFLESGVVSSVTRTGAFRLQTGMIGCEGMVGVSALLGGGVSSSHAYVQASGDCHRIRALDFEDVENSLSRAARTVLLRYVQAFLAQVNSTAAAAANFLVEQRLARWILMYSDRMESDLVQATHEHIAMSLGCRRPGVTVGMHVLEGRRLIRSIRGKIDVLDREGLIRFAAGSYGDAEAEYDRLIVSAERPGQGSDRAIGAPNARQGRSIGVPTYLV